MVLGFGFISGTSFSVHSIAPAAIISRNNKPQQRHALMYACILSSTDSNQKKSFLGPRLENENGERKHWGLFRSLHPVCSAPHHQLALRSAVSTFFHLQFPSLLAKHHELLPVWQEQLPSQRKFFIRQNPFSKLHMNAKKNPQKSFFLIIFIQIIESKDNRNCTNYK